MSLEDTLAEATRLLEADRPREALRLLRPLVPDHPADPDLHALLARTVRAPGRDDLADRFGAVAADPDDAATLHALGTDLLEVGEAALAAAILEEVHRRAPGRRHVALDLGVARGQAGDPAGAVAVLRGAADDVGSLFWPTFELHWNEALGVDPPAAREGLHTLGVLAEHPAEHEAQARLEKILERAAALDDPILEDRRAWHFILNGSVLLRLDPRGPDGSVPDEVSDRPGELRLRIRRLARLVERAERPDRRALHLGGGSEVLARVVAGLLPTWDAAPEGSAHRGVVCLVDDGPTRSDRVAPRLRLRRPGVVLWCDGRDPTRGSSVAEDATGLLARSFQPLWAGDGKDPAGDPFAVARRTVERLRSAPAPDLPPDDSDAAFDAFLDRVEEVLPLLGLAIVRPPFLVESHLPGVPRGGP